MGTKSLLGFALAAVAALTVLGRESPATGRSPRATRAQVAAPAAQPADASPEPAARPRIVGTDGPVAGARLAFFRRPDTVPVASAETDETGSFELPAARFSAFVARADGYPPKLFRPDEEGGREFRLDPGFAKKLSIVDEEGNPGAHADVDVYADGDLWLLFSSTRADERGEATLWLGGRESILVRLRGFATERVYSDETVVLRPGFSIAGRVVDTAGAPVPGATIDVDRSYG
ncbi:MAG TPA: hypothetical protein VFY93_06380 [Planctomycetota bacterium]|nr:hypothetical protein [Planctomycetota bacterium]